MRATPLPSFSSKTYNMYFLRFLSLRIFSILACFSPIGSIHPRSMLKQFPCLLHAAASIDRQRRPEIELGGGQPESGPDPKA